MCSHWVASGFLSSYTTPPFWSFFGTNDFYSCGGSAILCCHLRHSPIGFSTKLPSSRSSRRLARASGVLSMRICLLRVQLWARVPACVMGSCLLRVSAYVILAPVLVVSLSHWASVCMVAVCSSLVAFLMSPLMFSMVEEILLVAFSVALLSSSLASSHVL